MLRRRCCSLVSTKLRKQNSQTNAGNQLRKPLAKANLRNKFRTPNSETNLGNPNGKRISEASVKATWKPMPHVLRWLHISNTHPSGCCRFRRCTPTSAVAVASLAMQQLPPHHDSTTAHHNLETRFAYSSPVAYSSPDHPSVSCCSSQRKRNPPYCWITTCAPCFCTWLTSWNWVA